MEMLSVDQKDQFFSEIRAAIVMGVGEFLAAFRRDWPGETMYSFLLVAVWEGTYINSVAATEEGLLRIAEDYAEPCEGQLDQESFKSECARFRWGGYESGWYMNFDAEFFESANQLISDAHKIGLMVEGDQQLQQICLEVLRELDSNSIFGTGEAREKIVIGVSDVGGDHTEEDFLSWAEAVNPPVVMARLRSELQAQNELAKAAKELWLKSRAAKQS
jgi:hypothetical protein